MLKQFIHAIPKVELHLHIEGSLEPALMFQLAQRNKIKLPFTSIQAVKQAYQFTNLQSFLDIYYQSAQVLITEQDFFDLTYAYLQRVAKDNVRHVEIFFDPQTHTTRGIPFATVIDGISSALQEGEKSFNITSKLIMCFLRDLTEQDAFTTLNAALPYKDKIVAVGLDSAEQDNPPAKFQNVFQAAQEHGFLTVAHAGEEGPSNYIWQAIECLNVKRIDHGVQCIHDAKLMDFLKEQQIPLTVCPLSNIKLCVFDTLQQHPIKTLLDKGICVTINSDDPAFFGGYIEENYIQTATMLNLQVAEINQLAKNAINAAFLTDEEKRSLFNELAKCYEEINND